MYRVEVNEAIRPYKGRDGKTIESTVQADEKGVWIGGPTGEYRVKNVKVYDKEKDEYVPLDLEGHSTKTWSQAG